MIREAVVEDLDDIMECLSVLSPAPYNTEVDKLTAYSAFIARQLDGHILTYVFEEEKGTFCGTKSRVVGTITIVLETKLTHGGGLVGYISDVAVNKETQGKGVGSQLVQFAVDLCKSFGCYKVVLGCKPELEKYYERFGFKTSGLEMRLDIKD